VAGGLAVVAIFLGTEAIRALATESAPGRSISAIVSAGAAAVVLTPLGLAKYRVGIALRSAALKGDGTLSAISAALGVVALAGLLAQMLFGWWWADRFAALVAAFVAAGEAARVFLQRPRDQDRASEPYRIQTNNQNEGRPQF
jgi:divalent metal cation (Fe/Co/Zn/Cd) transporter